MSVPKTTPVFHTLFTLFFPNFIVAITVVFL